MLPYGDPVRVSIRPGLMDSVLAAVLTGLAVWGEVQLGTDGVDWVALALAVLTAAPIALRQSAPVAATGVMVGAVGALALLGYGYTNQFPGGGIGLLIGMFSVATLRPRPVAAAVFLPMVAVSLGYIWSVTDATLPNLLQSVLVMLGAWMLGDTTRRWALHTERLAMRAVQAVAEERVRIARELHDVVAHHMSVVSLQTGVAAYVINNDPQTAGKAIDAAGTASREALTEMRRLLDVLRVDHTRDPDDPGYRPQPGLGMLDGLAERARAAGVPVNVVVTGRPRPLPPGPDLCAYRVAQESLTNVLKHAGRASAQIVLDYGERTFTLVVRDNGVGYGAMVRSSSAGHGIRGMRERAELYGGVLTARPQPGGGFSVVLRLPMNEDG